MRTMGEVMRKASGVLRDNMIPDQAVTRYKFGVILKYCTDYGVRRLMGKFEFVYRDDEDDTIII